MNIIATNFFWEQLIMKSIIILVYRKIQTLKKPYSIEWHAWKLLHFNQ